jgi:Uroporphyrinogen decarboxylase (URO-D)
MNSKMRVARAMDLGFPDRVPFMCQLSIGHMLLNLGVSPEEFWNDPHVFAAGLLELRRLYDFDGILVSLHGHDPGWRSRVASRRESEDGVVLQWTDGSSTVYPGDELPRHMPARDSRSTGPGGGISIDLPERLDYIPVSQGLRFALHPDHLFDSIDDIVREAGREYSVHGEITSPFDYYLDLLGHHMGLIGLVDEPEKACRILQHFTDLTAALAGKMCVTGVDAIKISSPFAGAGFISRRFYEQFVLPYERALAAEIRRHGIHVYTHTCGAIGDRLDLLLSSGVSGIECLDPPPLGNVALEDALLVAQGRGFIKGNVDSVSVLLRGSRKEILADARTRLELGKRHAGYIFSTACSIAPHVPGANVRLLRDAVDRWG